jgi:hypothetical protein
VQSEKGGSVQHERRTRREAPGKEGQEFSPAVQLLLYWPHDSVHGGEALGKREKLSGREEKLSGREEKLSGREEKLGFFCVSRSYILVNYSPPARGSQPYDFPCFFWALSCMCLCIGNPVWGP